jgi:hypothetical protein
VIYPSLTDADGQRTKVRVGDLVQVTRDHVLIGARVTEIYLVIEMGRESSMYYGASLFVRLLRDDGTQHMWFTLPYGLHILCRGREK